jgi:hypothetical protein
MSDAKNVVPFPKSGATEANIKLSSELDADGCVELEVVACDGEQEAVIGVTLGREQGLTLARHLERLFGGPREDRL